MGCSERFTGNLDLGNKTIMCISAAQSSRQVKESTARASQLISGCIFLRPYQVQMSPFSVRAGYLFRHFYAMGPWQPGWSDTTEWSVQTSAHRSLFTPVKTAYSTRGLGQFWLLSATTWKFARVIISDWQEEASKSFTNTSLVESSLVASLGHSRLHGA